ncbi:MAG: hypothetical protein GF416_07605 [Candidatus Altiarchaeales archaeon]|nr:hypothetical protein [Candidatus Altiarchaeales archaeon]MBD3416977.1 hypothetical protein [Candidatus Altiarchaeales archaeon]
MDRCSNCGYNTLGNFKDRLYCGVCGIKRR